MNRIYVTSIGSISAAIPVSMKFGSKMVIITFYSCFSSVYIVVLLNYYKSEPS